MRIKKARIKNS